MRSVSVRAVAGCLVLFSLAAACGCSGVKERAAQKEKVSDKEKEKIKKTDGEDEGATASKKPWPIDAGKSDDKPKSDDGKKLADKDRADSREPKMEDAHIGGVTPGAGKKGPRAGTLTAGSFDDNLDPNPYRSFFRKIGQDGVLRDHPSRFLGHRLVLTVKDGSGQPVGNARVTITSDGGPGVELLSRTDGRVVFIPAWDQVPADADFQVTIHPPGGAAAVRQTVPRTVAEHTIVLPAFRAAAPLELDLTFVIDTTGSMGDELEYVKSEMRAIARTVGERFPQVAQRYALVFYRDEGDEYVTRRFDFTASIDDVRKNLHAQSAGGGGDTPEAVHRGLEDAASLQWRTGNTARVLFLLADAPPHAPHMARTLKAVNDLRKKGVAIYPVACSGYDNPTEFVMRTTALLTGGQFLFLTDDSGVGNAHTEPHLTNYHVERLDRLMIRLIAGELTGKRVAPAPNDIVRTVGRP